MTDSERKTVVIEFAPALPELADSPKVSFAPGIDRAELVKDDPEPMFVTVPLVKVGDQSRNRYPARGGGEANLLWDEPGVRHLAEEINRKRPEGTIGHVPANARGHAYELGKMRWVGAAIEGGTLLAKAYIPRHAADLREHMRIAQAAGASIGTSVLGTIGLDGARDIDLESIDLGHPGRLGNAGAAARPHLTSEMGQEDTMPEQNSAGADTRLAELETTSVEFHLLCETLDLGDDPRKRARAIVNELASLQEERSALLTELRLPDDAKPVEAAREIMVELVGLRAVAAVGEVDAILEEQTKDCPQMRPMLREFFLRDGKAVISDKAEIKTRVEELMETEAFKQTRTALGRTSMGPPVQQNAGKSSLAEMSGWKPDHSPEAMARDAASFGAQQ